MTADAAEVARIAAGLTEAQRRMLAGAVDLLDGRALICTETPARIGNARHPAIGLLRLGLTKIYSAKCDCLTPLGEQVRQFIQEQSK